MSRYKVAKVRDVAPGTTVRVIAGTYPVALVRIGDDWYALGDTCSHSEKSLSAGDVWEDEKTIECPAHGAQFDLETGKPVTLPATLPVARFDVTVYGDDVFVEVSDV